MTRTAIASLTAVLLATATGASAQTDPAAVPAPPPAPAMTAPAAVPAPAPAPADAMAAPAAPTVETPAPPPPPTGDVAYLIQALETVCQPLINKEPVKAVSKRTGYRSGRDGLTLKMPSGRTIVVVPPSVANPTLCRMTYGFNVDEWRPVVEGLNNWAYTRNPPLLLLYQGYKPVNGTTTTWSWELNTPQLNSGLAFNVRKNPDGSPVGRGFDVADVVYSYSPH
ncbi:MAG: hypothetical protein ACXW3D_00020 [Caulobacteraceae bacterium]